MSEKAAERLESLDGVLDDAPLVVEHVAERFHETYERLAPVVGYRTRDESAVPWEDVPRVNQRLMCWTVAQLVAAGVIDYGPAVQRWMGNR